MQQYAIAGDYSKSVGCGLTCLDKLYGVSVNMKPSAEEVADIYKEVKQKLLALPSVYLTKKYVMSFILPLAFSFTVHRYSLVSAPVVTDLKVQECFQIGGALIAASFFLSIDLLTVFLSRMLIVSIDEGTTAQSPMVMIWFAAFVAGSRYVTHLFTLMAIVPYSISTGMRTFSWAMI